MSTRDDMRDARLPDAPMSQFRAQTFERDVPGPILVFCAVPGSSRRAAAAVQDAPLVRAAGRSRTLTAEWTVSLSATSRGSAVSLRPSWLVT